MRHLTAKNKRKALLLLRKRQVLLTALLVVRRMQQDQTVLPRRRFGVHPINAARRSEGSFALLYPRLRADPVKFFEYTRMSPEIFDELLLLLKDVIPPPRRSNKFTLPLELRLLITLRFLATGETFRSLHFHFNVGRSTIAANVKLICEALYDVLQPIYLQTPSTPDEWIRIADEFGAKWDYPNCIGAIDGKHVQMKAPSNSGSMYFNHHQTFSIVLLAIVDANYCFTYTYCDIGAYGKQSDGGIFSTSDFGRALDQKKLNLPPPRRIHPTSDKLPFAFVADAAFPLKENLMRPFPGTNLPEIQSTFNYRLSRARRIVENAFGILRARWRVYSGPMEIGANMADRVVRATVCLHNFLRVKQPSYCEKLADSEDTDDGLWRENTYNSCGLTNIGRTGANTTARAAKSVRDKYATCFITTNRMARNDS